MTVNGIAYLEFHCEDARKYAAQLRDGYGFTVAAAPGRHPEDLTRVIARQGDITLVLTSAAAPDHPINTFVARHGDGVAVLALRCDDAEDATEQARAAVARGATATGDTGIEGFGDLTLRFVGADDPLLSGPEPVPGGPLREIDHLAICLPAGTLRPAVRHSVGALGFRIIFREYLEVGDQAMDSTVVQSPCGGITLTLIEPDPTREPGQIDRFLEAHGGAGVQHLAYRTDDIAGAVRDLTARDVAFLTTPGAYYDSLADRLGATGIPVGTLRELDLLVDQDHGGQLFQIFTRSTHPRNTFFQELIERRGADTFGSANIKALYEAVERERGDL
ncbi:4-hydroxyphenylpyruvate dioxygenase [Streptomyces sp. MUM 16J]|uniref:4-hydroxyphenylpyruvate dioxygenase n=1 Tax=Streptomyces sp. MUM 16J TaxID=2791988 RepID=UPI001F035FB0|nr:4-hydroxyphenylpyruvate dioxygenase [Streptomyces sp. MUM 16J]MCH0559338.1 4-hydroxyphenylpyruvate dioxygenase [Streptomyces sp. MUM 16J]